jgi:hypothetical protein
VSLYAPISRYGKRERVTGERQPHDLQAQLRELRLFAGELAEFDVSKAPEHPADLFLGWLRGAITTGVPERLRAGPGSLCAVCTTSSYVSSRTTCVAST